MLRTRRRGADGLPKAPRGPPGWQSPPDGRDRYVVRSSHQVSDVLGRTPTEESRIAEPKLAGKAYQRWALVPVADDQEGRITCAS